MEDAVRDDHNALFRQRKGRVQQNPRCRVGKRDPALGIALRQGAGQFIDTGRILATESALDDSGRVPRDPDNSQSGGGDPVSEDCGSLIKSGANRLDGNVLALRRQQLFQVPRAAFFHMPEDFGDGGRGQV